MGELPVNEVVVPYEIVVLERFAVIRGDNDDRILPKLLRLELVEHAAKVLVDEGDLAVVEVLVPVPRKVAEACRVLVPFGVA